jgi:hypothetical protein
VVAQAPSIAAPRYHRLDLLAARLRRASASAKRCGTPSNQSPSSGASAAERENSTKTILWLGESGTV